MQKEEVQLGSTYHQPIMVREVIDGLQINPDGVYVDATFGGGGHAKAILEKLSQKGKLFAFDQDGDALANVPKHDSRIIFIPENFRYAQKFLRLHGISKVDGLLADIGVSSHQFNKAERGFSTRFNAPLDMRMNQNASQTAQHILENSSEKELQHVFEQYGEVTNAKTVAKHIVENRSSKPIHTTGDLMSLLQTFVKGNPQSYFAQIFQALRIAVNDELNALEDLLRQSTNILQTKGRLVVLTFHSLEDRIVKNFLKNTSEENLEINNTVNPEHVLYGKPVTQIWKLINKKPITASTTELKNNSRARSAKLRIAEKL